VRSTLYLYPHWSQWKKLFSLRLMLRQVLRHATCTLPMEPRHRQGENSFPASEPEGLDRYHTPRHRMQLN